MRFTITNNGTAVHHGTETEPPCTTKPKRNRNGTETEPRAAEDVPPSLSAAAADVSLMQSPRLPDTDNRTTRSRAPGTRHQAIEQRLSVQPLLLFSLEVAASLALSMRRIPPHSRNVLQTKI